MTVYFFQRGDLIKIGTTTNLERRLGELRPGTLLGTEAGNHMQERRLHERFDAHRSHSEWFHFHADILDYVAALPPHEVQDTPPGGRKFDTYNRLVGGRLMEIILGFRGDGLSSAEILFQLRLQYGFDISDETLRRWLDRVAA